MSTSTFLKGGYRLMSPMKLDVLFSPSTPLYCRPRLHCSRASASLAITVSRTRGGLTAHAHSVTSKLPLAESSVIPFVCEPLDLL